MSSIPAIGPTPPLPERREPNSLGQAIDTYTRLLSEPTDLTVIAQQTVELGKLAQSAMHTTAIFREVAKDLEKILQSPLSVQGKPVSLLTASEHYLKNPETAELGPLIEELRHNNLAFKLMQDELTLLSSSIKNPRGAGN